LWECIHFISVDDMPVTTVAWQDHSDTVIALQYDGSIRTWNLKIREYDPRIVEAVAEIDDLEQPGPVMAMAKDRDGRCGALVDEHNRVLILTDPVRTVPLLQKSESSVDLLALQRRKLWQEDSPVLATVTLDRTVSLWN